MPRLRVLAGPSPDRLAVISANDGVPHSLSGRYFEGQVVVYIRDEEHPQAMSTKAQKYFDRRERKGVTWSIQVQGRLLQKHSADDVLFGNTFERPLKLPWGSGAALKFMHLVDPTLEHDLGGNKPWALSPLVSTMPYLAHQRIAPPASSSDTLTDSSWPAFPPRAPLAESCSTLAGPASKRRTHFSNRAHRQQTVLSPEDLLTADFCYGFLSFPSITLRLPCGISFDCMKYWDGQPVTFVCCERAKTGKGPGRTFWCVRFEVVADDGADADY